MREATRVHIVTSQHIDNSDRFSRIAGSQRQSSPRNPREYLALGLAIRDFVALLERLDLESHLIVFIFVVFSCLTAAIYFDRVFGVVPRQLNHIGIVADLATVRARTSNVH